MNTLVNPKSTHVVEVIDVVIEPHPNADLLGIVRVPNTDYTCIVRLSDWQGIKQGAWLPPDSVVDLERPEFSFLPKARIKAKKLRGIVSYGLLIPVPDNTYTTGQDVAEFYGVKHYDPEEALENNPRTKNLYMNELDSYPSGVFPKYDVDAFLKYGRKVFVPGERVYYTEKIHGCNARYVFQGDKFYCGSRTQWKREYPVPTITLGELTEKVGPDRANIILNAKNHQNLWWRAAAQTPAIEAFCRANPGVCLYGEVYGNVQNLKYGAKEGELKFAAFDVLYPDGTWMDSSKFFDLMQDFNVPHVPIITCKEFDFDEALVLAQGNSTLPGANHIREGIVVKPVKEKWVEHFGRAVLKVINPAYLEKGE